MSYNVEIPGGGMYPSLDGCRSVEWQLRHGDRGKIAPVAASYLSAYHELVYATEKRRAVIIRTLRQADKATSNTEKQLEEGA